MIQRFLDPAVLAGLSSLDLVAKTVVDGFISGFVQIAGFRFPRQEFAEYRSYNPATESRGLERICAYGAHVSETLPRRNQLPGERFDGHQRVHEIRLKGDGEVGVRQVPGGFHPVPGALTTRRRRADRVRRRSAQFCRAFHTARADAPPLHGVEVWWRPANAWIWCGPSRT